MIAQSRYLCRYLCGSRIAPRLLGMLLLLALAGCGGGATSAQSSGHGTPVSGGGGSIGTPSATATPFISSSPTSTPAVNWQSYQDSHYPFSVHYPADWTAFQDAHVDENPPYEVVSFYSGSGQSAPTLNVISITIAEQQPDDVQSGPPAGFAPAGDVTIAGATEKMFSGPGANGGQELLVEHDQGNYAYLFVSNAEPVSAAAFKQDFLKMLASFQA